MTILETSFYKTSYLPLWSFTVIHKKQEKGENDE